MASCSKNQNSKIRKFEKKKKKKKKQKKKNASCSRSSPILQSSAAVELEGADGGDTDLRKDEKHEDKDHEREPTKRTTQTQSRCQTKTKIVIPFPWISLGLCVVLILFSMAWNMYNAYELDFNLDGTSSKGTMNMFNYFYDKPWARWNPYLIGACFALFYRWRTDAGQLIAACHTKEDTEAPSEQDTACHRGTMYGSHDNISPGKNESIRGCDDGHDVNETTYTGKEDTSKSSEAIESASSHPTIIKTKVRKRGIESTSLQDKYFVFPKPTLLITCGLTLAVLLCGAIMIIIQNMRTYIPSKEALLPFDMTVQGADLETFSGNSPVGLIWYGFGPSIFALATTFIVLICLEDRGGILQTIAELSFWRPLAKLTYGVRNN